MKSETEVGMLSTLSDLPPRLSTADILSLITTAPDPETATRHILEQVTSHSDALRRKWRQTVWQIWSSEHPSIPTLPDVPLSSEDVATVPLLRDALAYLDNLAQKSAHLITEKKERLLSSEDIERLHACLPSSIHQVSWSVESEWSYVHLRRLRATLQALRLVRPVKNELKIVQSRYQSFLNFPATQQFYLLWHTNTYHISWAAFSGMWGDYIQMIQDNLPLLWDMHEHIQPGKNQSLQRWCEELLETFMPLWQETGLLDMRNSRFAWLKILRHYSLPPAIQRIVLHDVFEQYGLIEQDDTLLTEQFSWTKRGVALLTAERTQKLPCSLKIGF